MGDGLEVGGVGVRGGDDLEQAHVARGIEEVGAEPVAAEVFVGDACDDLVDGEAGGVGGGDGAGAAMDADTFEEGALDVEVFGDDLDDPVAVGDEAQVVVEVADSEEAGGVGGVEGGGFGLLEGFEGGEDDLVALVPGGVGGGSGRDDVEQDDGEAGVGDVGGDARAHGAGAEDGDLADVAGEGRACRVLSEVGSDRWTRKGGGGDGRHRQELRFFAAGCGIRVSTVPTRESANQTPKEDMTQLAGRREDIECATCGQAIRLVGADARVRYGELSGSGDRAVEAVRGLCALDVSGYGGQGYGRCGVDAAG